MCGISGIFNRDGAPALSAEVAAMSELLYHRGPDDTGIWQDGPLALAHRRLSILDLSPNGRNPMQNENASAVIVYNGETYNYRELRDELKGHGYRFRSKTDTEVVINLYDKHGLDAVERLNGMFAYALWDIKKKRLVLARDRFGVKPLYYTEIGSMFAFASEIKAFLALPEFRARLDMAALSEHLSFQNTFEDRTLFHGVRMLRPGHQLVVDAETIKDIQYWDLRFDIDSSRSPGDWQQGLRERFEVAVGRQLISDVPVGAFLSGGMDTGSIVSVAARQKPGMHTFTCGFDLPAAATTMENYFDESAESDELAALFGTDHHHVRLGPESMAPALADVVWHLDEPRVGISYPILYTAREVSRCVKVVLSGVGGDELFAGYPWRYAPIADASPANFEKLFHPIAVRLLTDKSRRRLLTPAALRGAGNYSSWGSFQSVLSHTQASTSLDKALYFDFKTFLHGLLVVEDKLNMAHSVESRVPFLDNDLVDYSTRIPAHLKLGGDRGKQILRDAMKGLVPDATLARRKQGFTPPDQTWYKEHAIGTIRELILGDRARERGYFEPSFIETILREHVSGRENHRFLIWSLMGLEWWNRLYVDREYIAHIRYRSGLTASRS
ncbi:MAG: asparagine synthase (glutamine-hydrolyzing) [Candidatus Omnitrophota bacterium]|nr:asparagine synthase (glutamine-hydrolyzing) [Candidatus Omnitrophota bacterium]